MRQDSLYFRFGTSHECVANVYGANWESVTGTNEETRIPVGGTLDALFHVVGRTSRWPDVFSGDDPTIKFFSLPLAERLIGTGLTGIELFPVQIRLGDLRSLKKKADQCPGYMWGRVTGILLVELFLHGEPWPLDPTGMFRLRKPRPSEHFDMKIRDEQPLVADFCRIVPGGSARIAISQRAAEFFDSLKLKDVIIGVRGNGYL